VAIKYTTADLLASIKSRMLIPTNQETFTNTSILTLADEELQNFIVPMIMDVREDYFVTFKSESPKNVAADQQPTFRMPERAIGNKLTDATIKDNSGNERSLPHYARPDSHDNILGFQYQSPTDGFTFQGNTIIILGNYGQDSSFNFYYAQRPNKLVETDAAGLITVVNTSTNEITVSSLPSTFLVGTEVDLVMGSPPYDNITIDQEISSISGTIIGLASLPTNTSSGEITVAVGDYVALAGEAPVIQLPTEFFSVLSQATVVRLLEALGDANGSRLAREALGRTAHDIISLVSPRVEGERKIVLARQNIFNYISRRTRWRF